MFLEVLIPAVAGIVILTFVMPRRYLANYLGWLAMPVVLFLLYLCFPIHRQYYGAGYAIGMGILFLAGMAIVLAVVLRLVVAAFLKRRRGQSAAAQAVHETAVFSSVMTRVQLFCAGSMAALVLFLFLRSLLFGMTPSWLAHAIAISAAVSLWIIPRLLIQEQPGPFVRAASMGFRWSLVGLIVAAAAMPILVAKKAEAIAGNAPYCIQVASRKDVHKPARTMLDLSGLTMKARGMLLEQQHALLVVGKGEAKRLYNWSYRNRAFVDESAYGKTPRYWPALYCAPQTGFVRRLPLLIPEESEGLYVQILGREYQIPGAYRPNTRGGYHPKLSLAADAPNFAPHDSPLNDNPRTRLEYDHRFVKIWFSPGDAWFNRIELSDDESALTEGEEFGLAKRTVQGQEASSRNPQYYLRDADGRLTTLIECGPAACRHRFLYDGLLFDFSQSRADMADWAELQQRLIRLMDSFAALDEHTPAE